MEKIKIKLNNLFYNKQSLIEAAKDYSNFCDVKILNDDFEIEMNPKIKTDEPLKDEFCNYVLGLMKNKSLV